MTNEGIGGMNTAGLIRAKSADVKAIASEAGISTIQLDLGAAKGSLVGQSEQQLRAAIKTINQKGER